MFYKLKRKIRDLLGVRSPTLESMGYYSCGNCQRHDPNCICTVCEEDEDMLYCPVHHKHVKHWDTCKRAKPIHIKPLAKKNIFKPGLRKNVVIDEWSDINADEYLKQLIDEAMSYKPSSKK